MSYENPNQWLADRKSMPTPESSKEISARLSPKVRSHCFFVARVAEARILDRIRTISDSYSRGELDLATARWKMREFLASSEGGGNDPTARGVANLASTARIDLILTQNASMAAAVGQYEQEMDPDALDLWPNWRYVHGHRRKPTTPRYEHKSLDGMVFKKTDPVWRRIFPPNGFRCSCGVVQCTDEEAERYGGVLDGRAITPGTSPDGFEFDPAHAFEEYDVEKTGLTPASQQYVSEAVEAHKVTEKSEFEVKRDRWREEIKAGTKSDEIADIMSKFYTPSMSELGDPPSVVFNPKVESSYFSRIDNQIVLKSNDLSDWMGSRVTLRHEFGHWVHERQIARDPSLRDRIETAAITDWVKIKLMYQARKTAGVGGLHELDEMYGPNSLQVTFAQKLFGIPYGSLTIDQRGLVCSMCDTIGSISNGAHGFGHSKKYYKAQNTRPTSRGEAVACIFSMRDFLPAETIKLAFPQMHAIVESIGG